MSMAVRISGAFKKFTGGLKVGTPVEDYSVYFASDADALTLADSSDFDIGLSSQAFTMEGFFRPEDNPSAPDGKVFGRGGGGIGWNGTNGNQWMLFYRSSQILHFQFWNGSSHVGIASSSSAYTVNDWSHWAVCYDGTTTRMFIDGTQVASTTQSYAKPSTSNITVINGDAESTSNGGVNRISNLRLIKGTALYTSNFTAPTSRLSAVTNTVLLTCQSATIVDNSASSHAITEVGSPAVSTTDPF